VSKGCERTCVLLMELIPDVLPGSRCASCSNSSGFESRDIGCTCVRVHVFLESPLQNTQGFYSVAPTFRFVCLILYFGLLCYLHKVKAQCGGCGFTSETKSLSLVLFDTGRFTLKKKVDWLV